METLAEVEAETQRKMEQSCRKLVSDLQALRSGRASATMFNSLRVDFYGTPTLLTHMASVNTPEAQLIVVTPFDPASAAAMEKAINQSDLGLNASLDNGVIRVPVPPLSGERRQELVRQVRRLGEDGRIAVRNVRRDANDQLKRLPQRVSEDEERKANTRIQKETDRFIQQIEESVRRKEEELLRR